MPYTYTVPTAFIEYRDNKATVYNRRGRKHEQFLMDIDCEFYEWTMIDEEMWMSDDDWRVDAWINGPDGGLAVDVKFISKFYNISPVKMCNIIAQRKVLHGYLFMEWITRPERPLQAGDEVAVNLIGYVDYETLIDNIRPSKFNGHYVDVRKLKL